MSVRTIEKNEVINSGEYLIAVIDEIIKNIDKAKIWGVVDIVGNHSFFSSLLKHDKLHQANNLVPDLQNALETFNTKLHDVQIYYQTKELKMSTTIEVLDVLMDNLLVDGYALYKIVESKTELNNLKQQVQNVLYQLGQTI